MPFRRAGEIAPAATLWRAYLARAGGAPPPVEAVAAAAGEPWVPVPPGQTYDLRFDPTGERMVTGQEPALLLDARSGEVIAVLSHRGAPLSARWSFDRTGRLIVGAAWRPPSSMYRGLDVRDARTGDPLAYDATIEVARDTPLEWVPSGTPPPGGASGRVGALALADGELRYGALAVTTNEDLAVSPDGSRTALLKRSVPSSLRLLDSETGDRLAAVCPGGGRVEFSRSGRLLASFWADPVVLLDAESGERLPVPGPPGQRLDDGSESWCLDGDLLVWARATGEAQWRDPFQEKVVRRVRLEPPPRSGVTRLAAPSYSGGELSPDGLRLTIGPTLQVLDVRTGLALGSLGGQPLTITDLLALDDAEACVAACSDGSLRRIDVPSGAITALALGQLGEGFPELRSVGAGRMASTVPRRSLVLCSSGDLAFEARVDLRGIVQVEALAPEGRNVLVFTDDGDIDVVETGSGTRRTHARPHHSRQRLARPWCVLAGRCPAGDRVGPDGPGVRRGERGRARCFRRPGLRPPGAARVPRPAGCWSGGGTATHTSPRVWTFTSSPGASWLRP